MDDLTITELTNTEEVLSYILGEIPWLSYQERAALEGAIDVVVSLRDRLVEREEREGEDAKDGRY